MDLLLSIPSLTILSSLWNSSEVISIPFLELTKLTSALAWAFLGSYLYLVKQHWLLYFLLQPLQTNGHLFTFLQLVIFVPMVICSLFLFTSLDILVGSNPNASAISLSLYLWDIPFVITYLCSNVKCFHDFIFISPISLAKKHIYYTTIRLISVFYHKTEFQIKIYGSLGLLK